VTREEHVVRLGSAGHEVDNKPCWRGWRGVAIDISIHVVLDSWSTVIDSLLIIVVYIRINVLSAVLKRMICAVLMRSNVNEHYNVVTLFYESDHSNAVLLSAQNCCKRNMAYIFTKEWNQFHSASIM